MADDERSEILNRLDAIIAIMQLAFKDRIDAARSAILADSVAAAILERSTGEWVDAGTLREQVSKQVGQSERTVSRRITSLVGQRALAQSGSGPKVRYRTTGLI